MPTAFTPNPMNPTPRQQIARRLEEALGCVSRAEYEHAITALCEAVRTATNEIYRLETMNNSYRGVVARLRDAGIDPTLEG